MATKKNKKPVFGIYFTMLLLTIGFISPSAIPNKFYGVNNEIRIIKQNSYNPLQTYQQPDSAKK